MIKIRDSYGHVVWCPEVVRPRVTKLTIDAREGGLEGNPCSWSLLGAFVVTCLLSAALLQFFPKGIFLGFIPVAYVGGVKFRGDSVSTCVICDDNKRKMTYHHSLTGMGGSFAEWRDETLHTSYEDVDFEDIYCKNSSADLTYIKERKIQEYRIRIKVACTDNDVTKWVTLCRFFGDEEKKEELLKAVKEFANRRAALGAVASGHLAIPMTAQVAEAEVVSDEQVRPLWNPQVLEVIFSNLVVFVRSCH